MKHACTFVIVYFLLAVSLFAQPEIEWERSFGGSNNDFANSIKQTRDGGYIAAGTTYSQDGDIFGSHGYIDAWVVKVDESGILEWKKLYGGSDLDEASDIIQTSDDGFIMLGTTYSNNWDVSGQHGGGDIWLVKMNENGTIQWQRCLGGSEKDFGYDLEETNDGGYVVAGYTASSDGDVTTSFGGSDYWVVKLDNLGSIEWQRSYGGLGKDYGHSICQTSDGGYIVAGQSNSPNGHISNPIGDSDFWVVKLNFEGKIEWEKSLGGTGFDVALGIIESSQGDYVILGHVRSSSGQVTNNHGGADLWLVKLDTEGNLVWEHAIGGSSEDYAGSLSETNDGGYLLCGHTYSTDGDVVGNDGGVDLWLVKTNPDGEILWQKTLGGSSGEEGNSAHQTVDGGYIAAGYSWSNNGDVTQNKGKADMWIVKLSPETTPTQAPITQSLQLYPNPATDRIYWQLPRSDPYNDLNIRILNTFGQVIRHIPVYTEMSLDVSDLSAGLYLLEVSTASGEKLLGRFLKP